MAPTPDQTETATGVAQHLDAVTAQIGEFSQKYNREPDSVALLAVSKTKPSALIREAAACGQTAFGENYAEEGVEKRIELADLGLCWHYIGHIQSNKTKLIASHYDWVQGVDRIKIANRLNEHRGAERDPLNLCIQLKIDAEESKSGCTIAELDALADCIAAAPHLTLRGLMAIPAPRNDFAEQRAVFAQLREWFDKLQTRYATVDTLSMGMSGDMEAAIAEGATMVRIGTAVFGARDKR